MSGTDTVEISAGGESVTMSKEEFDGIAGNPFSEDLSKWEFQVKVTYVKPDVTEVFDTLEKAKAFAHDQLKDARVVKVHIKKVEPDDDDKKTTDEDDGL